MEWAEVLADPVLQDLPYKIELNEYGKIVMSPASNRHLLCRGLIIGLLGPLLADGEVILGCSIQTADGVKVADVAWVSADFLRRHGVANPYPEAPEIVIEILSPSNTLAEMEEKKELYFARGAREFWVCEEDGLMRFYNNHAQLAASALAPGFPARVELPFA